MTDDRNGVGIWQPVAAWVLALVGFLALWVTDPEWPKIKSIQDSILQVLIYSSPVFYFLSALWPTIYFWRFILSFTGVITVCLFAIFFVRTDFEANFSVLVEAVFQGVWRFLLLTYPLCLSIQLALRILKLFGQK